MTEEPGALGHQGRRATQESHLSHWVRQNVGSHGLCLWCYAHECVKLHGKKDFAVIIKITDQMTLDWEIIVDIWIKPV